MCKDCGCTIAGMEQNHSHNHNHDHGHSHHHHDHENRTIFKPINDNLKTNPLLNDSKTISVIQKILDKNDHEAAHNRAHFDQHKVLGINLMSSPGSGKTTLLENIADMVDFKFAVVEGDLETSRDADRLKAKGINAVQKQTSISANLISCKPL